MNTRTKKRIRIFIDSDRVDVITDCKELEEMVTDRIKEKIMSFREDIRKIEIKYNGTIH